MEAPEIAEQFSGPKRQCEELLTHLHRAWQQMTIHIFKYERKCELVGANHCSLFYKLLSQATHCQHCTDHTKLVFTRANFEWVSQGSKSFTAAHYTAKTISESEALCAQIMTRKRSHVYTCKRIGLCVESLSLWCTSLFSSFLCVSPLLWALEAINSKMSNVAFGPESIQEQWRRALKVHFTDHFYDVQGTPNSLSPFHPTKCFICMW